MRVLVIEDDPKIARFLHEGLEGEQHEVEVVGEGGAGLERARSGEHDLLLLDLMLPGASGIEILAAMRAAGLTTPVIAITARGDVEDRVRGLDAGADDYLVKPFSLVELLARIRALFRRSEWRHENRLQVRDLVLDRAGRLASRNGTTVELTPREQQLLEYFMLHPGQPLTRAMIADHVWGYRFEGGTNVIDVYVTYLRKKLARLDADACLRTVRGVGYRLDPEALAAVAGG